jgi:hypothetical protein
MRSSKLRHGVRINGLDSFSIQWLRLKRNFAYREIGIPVDEITKLLQLSIPETPTRTGIYGPDSFLIQWLRLNRDLVATGFLSDTNLPSMTTIRCLFNICQHAFAVCSIFANNKPTSRNAFVSFISQQDEMEVVKHGSVTSIPLPS